MFGMGMNNNGTGLVLAASDLGTLPWAVVPVLFYNLVQHLVAGGVARVVDRRCKSCSDGPRRTASSQDYSSLSDPLSCCGDTQGGSRFIYRQSPAFPPAEDKPNQTARWKYTGEVNG
jgi:hypothetical protein